MKIHQKQCFLVGLLLKRRGRKCQNIPSLCNLNTFLNCPYPKLCHQTFMICSEMGSIILQFKRGRGGQFWAGGTSKKKFLLSRWKPAAFIGETGSSICWGKFGWTLKTSWTKFCSGFFLQRFFPIQIIYYLLFSPPQFSIMLLKCKSNLFYYLCRFLTFFNASFLVPSFLVSSYLGETTPCPPSDKQVQIKIIYF